VIIPFLGLLLVACGGADVAERPALPPIVAERGSQIVAVAAAPGQPAYRLNAQDAGPVLKHGDPEDPLGARDVFVYQAGGTYYMTYDGAGPEGWRATLATSPDFVNWTKKGTILELGAAGRKDAAAAAAPMTYFDGSVWHTFYVGTPNATAAPNRVPLFPYLTLKAKAASPAGPWTKQYDVTPFSPTPGTYYSRTASPGPVIKRGDTYLMFFSSTTLVGSTDERSIAIARTKDLDGPWTPDPKPLLPTSEQIENAALYYQEATGTWFMFVNHIDVAGGYTDAIWVYWSQDLERWDANNKAVVLDGSNSSWSRKIIGLPSVIEKNGKLAILYDGRAAELPAGADPTLEHMNRDVGLAWVDLPIGTRPHTR